MNPSNQLDVESDEVALISCDGSDYPGNIDQSDVFLRAVSRNVTAVLFYSRQADYCRTEGDLGDYRWVFSMKSRNDTSNVLSAIAGANSPLWVTIGGPDSHQGQSSPNEPNGNGRNNEHMSDDPQGPLGPNPSTAVAMIILYTITGLITALFLVIIITGALRAHRHPERYGPRAMVGRPRQSRARGIGRAILDGIPIVKFGEREEQKQADVELGSTSANQETNRSAEASTEEQTAQGVPHVANLDGAPGEDGIAAAAAASAESTTANENDHQGCSICTEDFERGQDQRVLPCDHRFHPECIDPWLLNVSGTCPLCRVDLRPQPSRTSQDVDANGNPVPREGEDELGGLSPPIAERSSVRRSLMIGILGIRGRPDHMSREERILALRRYREQQAARRRRDSNTSGATAGQVGDATEAQDSRIRSRMRTLLGVRTRRTGEHDRAAEEPSEHGSGPADSTDQQDRT